MIWKAIFSYKETGTCLKHEPTQHFRFDPGVVISLPGPQNLSKMMCSIYHTVRHSDIPSRASSEQSFVYGWSCF